jgi:hypothetical protein
VYINRDTGRAKEIKENWDRIEYRMPKEIFPSVFLGRRTVGSTALL